MKNVIWLCFFLALTLATRCSNYADVFIGGKIYFIDADCYSRMTRVREVLAHPGAIIRHHDWENFPQGTDPHTTAPMDYLIAALAAAMKLLAHFSNTIRQLDPVDLAGALVSPILGLLTTAFLGFWARELMTQRYRRVMLLFASISPVLVHGTILGRPDHQSLLIFLMAVAIGAELVMARSPDTRWAVISAAAWALGLWVSLYEPLILMATILITKILFYRQSLIARERIVSYGVFIAIITLALLIEGWHVEVPDEATRHYFENWKNEIGEMTPLWRVGAGGVFRSLLFRWVGFGLLFSPLILIARLRDTKRSLLLLALLLVTFGWTLAQARWGYFFALVFAISLPWQLSLFNKRWLVLALFFASLWPVLIEWDERLWPGEERRGELFEHRKENVLLREVAEHLRAPEKIPLLAPWWLSPPLVYWSGQPALAGSSHESLSGIVDTARFFTAADFADARMILEKRGVRAVVLCEPARIVETSYVLLGHTMSDTTIADTLWRHPHSAPPFLHIAYDNLLFKVFAVDETLLKASDEPGEKLRKEK